MLPKKSRLTKKEIEGHLLKAKRVKGHAFTLIYKDILGVEGPKISVSVPKKVAQKAVVRNKLRRRAYNALRPVLPSIKKTTIGLVVYSSKDTKIALLDLKNEFERVFAEAKILKN
jgi:ribonuclease P protein component